jgi:hypothetical protein
MKDSGNKPTRSIRKKPNNYTPRTKPVAKPKAKPLVDVGGPVDICGEKPAIVETKLIYIAGNDPEYTKVGLC